MQRLIFAVLASFVAAMLVGPILIPWLKKLKVGQTINDFGPRSHMRKQGTVTMGGLIFIPSAIVCAILFSVKGQTPKYDLWFLILTMLLFAAIGFLDDYIKVVRKRSEGLTPKQKLLPQILLGIAIAVFAYNSPYIGSKLRVPFSSLEWDLGWFYIPFTAFVIVAMVNSSNLLDGLDGLCAGNGMIDFAALALIALSMSVLPDGTTDNDLFNTAIFCASLCGALLGFLRFNTHPASVFMGDVGSFAIGGAMVAVAIVTRQMLILPIIAFTMVLASLSDLIQFAYFRISHGKRVFRMAPLQHHFELSGIPETRIVAMYDIVTAMMCLIALSGFVG